MIPMTQNVAEKPKDPELTPRQAAGLVALLSFPTVTAAAKLAQVDRRTLQRWMKLPIFREAIREAQTGALDRAGLRLAHGMEAALNLLADLIRGKGEIDQNRRLAAEAWLDKFYKLYELRNLNERIEKIEERQRAEAATINKPYSG
jgi:hypothetical protein